MRTLLDPTAANDIQAPKSPVTVFINAKSKALKADDGTIHKGHFRPFFKPKGEEGKAGAPKESVTFTVLANYFAIKEKGIKNTNRAYSNYFTDWTDPLEVTIVSPNGEKRKLLKFEDGQSYGTAKDEIKEAKCELVLYVIGFINNGHLLQLELSSTNLYNWNQLKRSQAIDLAETPTVTLTYKDARSIPNEYSKDEPLYLFDMTARPMGDDERAAMEKVDTNELREYLAYRRMSEKLAQLASNEANAGQKHTEDYGDDAPEDEDDTPPNFPEAQEMPEVEETDDDLPW